MSKDDLNFEEIMLKLENITNKLENDNLSLNESVELFEEGMKLSKQANEKLENAEKRITILLDTDNLKEENFVPEEWNYKNGRYLLIVIRHPRYT